MAMIKTWISAARLRTLPLSISGILIGSVLGSRSGFQQFYLDQDILFFFFQTPLFWLAILTTLGLQIVSNFANDYGDGIKGTDNEQRIGPVRAIQSGIISSKQMKNGIRITVLITFLSALSLIYLSFKNSKISYAVFFFLLGIAAIAAAIKYTVGNSAYGYKGLGDLFVFIFFGLVSVLGCYFLYQKELPLLIILPATSIGLLSTAVLNLNNMRDITGDKAAHKNTLVVKMGSVWAKKYHVTLVGIAIASILIFHILTLTSVVELITLLVVFPLGKHLITVQKIKDPYAYDPELKKVALSTFFMSLFFSLGQILSIVYI